MTYVEISCGTTTARLKSLGAELVSLRRDGHEYLWQGDPAFWDGQSPLLFPNTGRYWDNLYRLNGKQYEQKAHGFARNMEFDIVEQKPDSVTFALHSNEQTEQVYPFRFFLFVKYAIVDSALTVEWFVRNQGDTEMHFQIGAHPAFNLPDYSAEEKIHGYFSFEPEVELHYLEPLEKGCVDHSKLLTLQLDERKMMPLTSRTFDCDTYVIESAALRSCTLHDPQRRPHVTVDFHMPVLALWSPTAQHPDCPFVCIEPWCGSCDTIGYDGDLADRRHEQHLAPSAHFLTSYTIRLH